MENQIRHLQNQLKQSNKKTNLFDGNHETFLKLQNDLVD